MEFLADIEAVTPLCPVFIECHQEALVSLLTDPLSSLPLEGCGRSVEPAWSAAITSDDTMIIIMPARPHLIYC